MTVGPILEQARAAFLRRMRASCRVERPTGALVYDPVLMVDVPEVVLVSEPRCYVRYPGIAFEQSPEVAGAVLAQSRVVVRLPFGVQYRPGDVVTILSDPDNPQMVGARLRVESCDDQSQASAQRLLCNDEQTGVTA